MFIFIPARNCLKRRKKKLFNSLHSILPLWAQICCCRVSCASSSSSPHRFYLSCCRFIYFTMIHPNVQCTVKPVLYTAENRNPSLYLGWCAVEVHILVLCLLTWLHHNTRSPRTVVGMFCVFWNQWLALDQPGNGPTRPQTLVSLGRLCSLLAQ